MLSVQEQDRRFVADYAEVNAKLLDCGWIVTGWIAGGELEDLKQYLRTVPDIEGSKRETYEEINRRLIFLAFDVTSRAFQAFRARSLPHTSEVSHHLDQASLHYYKRDFFSAALCLLPAVEGVMLRHIGWTRGSSRKPTTEELLSAIATKKTTIESLSVRYEIHKNALVAFLKRWIFADLRVADLELSFLNRHYALHLMGNESYYAAADCHRLFLLFDTYIDLIAYETGQALYAFAPDHEPSIDLRRNLFAGLILGHLQTSEVRKLEEQILLQNKNFHLDREVPTWPQLIRDRIKKNEAQFARLREIAKTIHAQKSEKPV